MQIYLPEALAEELTQTENVLGTIYLLHFERPFKHARHYLGWATQLEERLWHHKNGTGANLLKHVRAAGISWTLVRTWENADRNEERRIKNMGGLARVCPDCQFERAMKEVTG